MKFDHRFEGSGLFFTISDNQTAKAAAHAYQAVLSVSTISFLMYSFVTIVRVALNCCIFITVICVSECLCF